MFTLAIAVAMVCATPLASLAVAQMAPQYGGSGGNDGYYGRQGPSAGSNTGPAAGGAGDFQGIQGLEGFKGFYSGQNLMSIAVMPISQKSSQLQFQVIGFAISSPGAGTGTIYSLNKPFPGVIDPSQNTLQIDFTNIETAIDKAGYIDSSEVYDALRADPNVIIIDVDMDYQGNQGSQTTFNVNGVDIVPPDGRMQAFDLQDPTQLVIDAQAMRLYMVAFPQMIDSYNSYSGASYTQVMPVVYTQPVPIMAPVFTPYLRPFPVFTTGFRPYRPFHYGNTYVSYYQRTNARYPIHSRNIGRNEYNSFRRTTVNRPISGGTGSTTVRRPGAVGGGFSRARTGGGRRGGRR